MHVKQFVSSTASKYQVPTSDSCVFCFGTKASVLQYWVTLPKGHSAAILTQSAQTKEHGTHECATATHNDDAIAHLMLAMFLLKVLKPAFFIVTIM